MRILVLICRQLVWLLLCLPLVSFAAQPGLGIEYDIHWANKQSPSELNIKMSFIGSPKGRTVVIFPYKWASNNNLFQTVSNIRVENGVLENTQKPYIKVLKHKPNAKVSVSYSVRQSFTGDPKFVYQSQMPIILPNYFHFVGKAMLAYPNLKVNTPVKFSLNWTADSPEQFANSFGSNQKQQIFSGKLKDLLRGVYIGGDYRITTIKMDNGEISLAVKGQWPFSDQQFATALAKVVSLERSFWKEKQPLKLLTTLIPLDKNLKTYSGMALKNAFVINVPEAAPLSPRFFRLIAHEYFHRWNHSAILRRPKREKEYYWFTEGFTDYYANVINLRGGVIDLKEYVNLVNKVLVNYYTSSEIELDNADIRADFWKNYTVQRLPYQRGLILAHNWDIQIRKRSHNQLSLDDLMRDLIPTTYVPKLDLQQIKSVASGYLGRNVSNEIQKFIVEGDIQFILPDSLGPCVHKGTRTIREFEYGFLPKESILHGKIMGLKETSKPYQLGIRKGDKVIKLFQERQKKGIVIVLVVMQKGQEKRISYPAQRGPKIRIPQFKLDETMYRQDPSFCLKRFNGSS